MASEPAYSRREILKRLGLAGAAVAALPELARVLNFQRAVIAQTLPLSAHESATLGAICARIIPTDENGPGAAEARASRYIERSLAGWLSSSRDLYVEGLAVIDEKAVARASKRFIDLTRAEQDAVLTELQETPFFAIVRAHTIQGTLCDPAYGGNANFVGWDLIGYPGIRLSATPEDQRMSSPPKPVRRSAYEYAMFSAMGAADAH